MSSSEKNTSDPGFIKTLSSLQFGLVILISIACVAVVGTVIPQGRAPVFYREHYGAFVNLLINVFRFNNTYNSPLFLGLLALFGLNLSLCSILRLPGFLKRTFKPNLFPDSGSISRMPVTTTVSGNLLEDVHKSFNKAGFPLRRMDKNHLFGEKGRYGYLGAFTVHLSLLVLLIGSMISLITGFRGVITLYEGESTDATVVIPRLNRGNEHSIPLGFEIALDSFDVVFYEDFPGRPKSYTSSVTVTLPDGGSFKKDIRVNSPLMLNNFTVYQSSYGLSEGPFTSSAMNDTAAVAVRLKGASETIPPVTTLDMVIGERYTVPGFGDSITVSLAELHRNFKSAADISGELNPAIKIDVLVNNDLKWSIYAFNNFPGLNMPMYGDIPLSFSMLDIKTGGSTAGEDEGNTYYTVLGVVGDRGTPVMWVGASLLMLGMFLSFYVRPRRIWVLEDNGKILIGGRVKGDPEQFRNFVRKILNRIEE